MNAATSNLGPVVTAALKAAARLWFLDVVGDVGSVLLGAHLFGAAEMVFGVLLQLVAYIRVRPLPFHQVILRHADTWHGSLDILRALAQVLE
jgi:hypothetical protein